MKKQIKLLSFILAFVMIISCTVNVHASSPQFPSYDTSYIESVIEEIRNSPFGAFLRELRTYVYEYMYPQVEEDPLAGTAYAIYSEDDQSFTFMRSETEPIVGETHNGKTISEVYTGFETTVYDTQYEDPHADAPWFRAEDGTLVETASKVKTVIFEDAVQPLSTAGWFGQFMSCEKIDLTNLDTSLVTDMSGMFYAAGMNVETFELIGLDKLDMTNVVDMQDMFNGTASRATTWTLGDLTNWNLPAVENMDFAFFGLASNSPSDFYFEINGWNMPNVTSMVDAFRNSGHRCPNWSMTIKDFNTPNLQTIYYLFQQSGYYSDTWHMTIENWDTSSVTNMQCVFHMSGYESDSWSVEGLENLNTESVTTFNNMFSMSGCNAASWHVGDLSAWKTPNVTDFSYMFYKSGSPSTNWYVGDISSWDVSKCVIFNYMFYQAGMNSNYQLDLSDWNYTCEPTRYKNFDTGVESKVIAPWD